MKYSSEAEMMFYTSVCVYVICTSILGDNKRAALRNIDVFLYAISVLFDSILLLFTMSFANVFITYQHENALQLFNLARRLLIAL